MEKQLYVVVHPRGFHYVELLTAQEANSRDNVVLFSSDWFNPNKTDVVGYIEEPA